MVTPADLAGLAADSGARMIAVSAEFIGAAREAAFLPTVREVVVAGETQGLGTLLVPVQAGPARGSAR